MGVEKKSKISANNNVNHPNLIGNTNESNPNNSVRPLASHLTYEPPTLAQNSQETAAATEQNVASLFSFPDHSQKSQPETLWWSKAAMQSRTYTKAGAAVLICLWIKEFALDKSYFGAVFCFLAGSAIYILCVFGERRRDWRFVFAVLITAFVVAVYSVVDFILTAIATIIASSLSDAELEKLNIRSRGLEYSVGILQCVFRCVSVIYWVLIAYYNFKIGNLVRAESIRISQQPASGNEARGDASVIGKEVAIDRDMTRAGTFANAA